MEIIPFTTDMLLILIILLATILLLITELVRIDVAAMLAMVSIGIFDLVPTHQLLNGFSSNAVIAIIAIMIIGGGLDKAGVMTRLANLMLKLGGKTEKGILPIILATVGLLSSFMQNVGTAALFLPVVTRIAERTQIPLSRLLIPMGYCTILGGTITMVGCSSLIILNDLLDSVNSTLPVHVPQIVPFSLFATTTLGLTLLLLGIGYFLLLGRWLLPATQTKTIETVTPMTYFQRRYGVKGDVFELLVTHSSPLAGETITTYLQQLHHQAAIVALLKGKNLRTSPAPDVTLEIGDSFAIMGDRSEIHEFATRFDLILKPHLGIFNEMLLPEKSGVTEVIIPPSSQLIGHSLLSIRMRKTYGISVLEVLRHNQVIRENLRDLILQSGDILVAHCTWEDLAALRNNRHFITMTQECSETQPPFYKMWLALFFLGLSLSLVLFTELRLSIALLIGALGMIVTGIISIDDSYKRVSWQTVFLLASLIPLGNAMQNTGTATWIAQNTLILLGDMPNWLIQTVLALLATLFTQMMSNVGTTVLLVPLAVNIAVVIGADPALFALTVALATSNSFFLPTHQVNALLMGPGGYRVKDYMKAGGLLSVLFIIILILWMQV